MKRPKIYFVLPCYNEDKCLKQTYCELDRKCSNLLKANKISPESKIVFVDDGSKDRTWEVIEALEKNNDNVVGIKLAHNVGHQNALFAGLMFAGEEADASISMDADLQDNLSVVDGFIDRYGDGYEIIYGVRGSRKSDSRFKRWSAQMFYGFMHVLGVDLVYNAADCRLMSKRAMQQLGEYSEINMFLRGIVPLIGLKSTTVEYVRDKRLAGESKYPLKKMLSFAWDGITSFSVKPIRLVLAVGVLVFFLSLAIMVYALIRWGTGQTVDGWTFTICSIWLVAGIQTMSIGLIGEYIGKIYSETKRRPRFFVEKIIGEKGSAKK